MFSSGGLYDKTQTLLKPSIEQDILNNLPTLHVLSILIKDGSDTRFLRHRNEIFLENIKGRLR